MKLRLSLLAALAGVSILAACATPPAGAKLTYETSPAGATLYEGGQSLGVAPVMRTYPGDAAGGQIRTPDVTAVWPSGAKTTFFTILKVGDDNVTTLTRPANAPNVQVDLDNALKYQSAEERAKAAMLRDQKRSSARCLAQQSGASKSSIDDCN